MSKRKNSFASRRRFLQSCGLGGASLLLPSLMSRSAKAYPDDPPLRIIFFFTEHGTFYDNWAMRQPGLPESEHVAWEFNLAGLTQEEFSPILAPLHPFRDRMMVLDGLALLTAMSDPYGDGHAKGWCSSLTGNWARETYEDVKSHAATASIDQMIKAHLRAENPDLTDLVGVEYTVAPWEGTFHHLSYAKGPDGEAYKVPQLSDPVAAFDILFPNEGMGAADPIEGARMSVLDVARNQYDALAPQLSSEDRAKLELHRDLIHDLQDRITFLETLDCGAPTLPTPYAGWEWEGNVGENFEYRTQAFIDLIAASMSCRVSQVVTLQAVIPPLDVIGGSGDYHNDYAHQSAWDAPQEKIDVVTEAERQHAQQVFRLAERLDSIPEGDGTLLDNTVIVWISELANGGHEHDQWPVVMIGGAANKFDMGRYIRFPRNTPRPKMLGEWSPGGFVGQAHNPLLVSLCRAMGMDIDYVGKKSVTGWFDDGGSTQIGLSGGMSQLYG